ncbi:MAG: nucleoside deaminase [Rhodothermales bacterium]|nr:nucleoside deaminase [Rhodothermales bacterium]
MRMKDLVEKDRNWMKRALREAERALDQGEVPVGAVIVFQDTIVGRGHNMVETLNDATAHAEILAITAASDTLKSKVLADCTLYVTLEPCPMCAGAIVLARLKRLVFGAFDEKAGSASTLYNIPQDKRLNHSVEIVSGIEEEACGDLLRSFFMARRSVN